MQLEEKYRHRDEGVSIPETLGHAFVQFPGQGAKLTKEGGAQVWLEPGDSIDIDYDLGRFIVFALKLRIEETRDGFAQLSSGLKKNLLLLSNCHRVLLAAIGLAFTDVRENEFGSRIILEFFLDPKHRSADIQTTNIAGVPTAIEAMKPGSFPICINLFRRGNASEHPDPVHSFIALGRSRQGHVICFHKNGFEEGKPIELTSLDSVLAEYAGDLIATLIPEAQLAKHFEEMRDYARAGAQLSV